MYKTLAIKVRDDDSMKQFDLFSSLWASLKVKCKGKFHPRTAHEHPENEYRYIYTLSLPLALDGPYSDHFTPRKESRYPLYRRLGGL
jgi:hypothetical protein